MHVSVCRHVLCKYVGMFVPTFCISLSTLQISGECKGRGAVIARIVSGGENGGHQT